MPCCQFVEGVEVRGGEAPSPKIPSPSPCKERGTKGVRLLTNLRRGKRFNLGVISILVALLVVSIAFMGGCTGEPSSPVPPIEPELGKMFSVFYLSIVD